MISLHETAKKSVHSDSTQCGCAFSVILVSVFFFLGGGGGEGGAETINTGHSFGGKQ